MLCVYYLIGQQRIASFRAKQILRNRKRYRLHQLLWGIWLFELKIKAFKAFIFSSNSQIPHRSWCKRYLFGTSDIFNPTQDEYSTMFYLQSLEDQILHLKRQFHCPLSVGKQGINYKKPSHEQGLQMKVQVVCCPAGWAPSFGRDQVSKNQSVKIVLQVTIVR